MPRSRIAPAGLGRPPRPKQHCACART
jgi:hypothetical protein